ncbi:MAG: TAXI family TRAP transporter solute-binding subunit [Hyphomicrobiaceae bacterium]
MPVVKSSGLVCGALAGLAMYVGAAAGLLPASAQTSPSSTEVSIGTGSPIGVYYVAGNAICRLVDRKAATGSGPRSTRPMSCSAPSTPGSIFNLDALRRRQLTFAVVQSDWQLHAFRGGDRFAGTSFASLRSVLSLHPEVFQILAGRGTGIETFSDLKAKRISLGEKGSGTRSTFGILMQAYGIDISYFSRAVEVPFSEQNDLLCNGELDAVAYAIGMPNALVRDAIERCGATLVEIAGDAVEKLALENKSYSQVVIPAGTYKDVQRPVPSFGVLATLVTRADTPEDIVYNLTRTIFEGLEDLKSMHRAFANLKRYEMIQRGLTAPLHAGALRYYVEQGWVKPDPS